MNNKQQYHEKINKQLKYHQSYRTYPGNEGFNFIGNRPGVVYKRKALKEHTKG
jgi:hypothetical protein